MVKIYENTSHSAWHILSAQEMFYSEYGTHGAKRQLRQKINSLKVIFKIFKNLVISDFNWENKVKYIAMFI